MKIRLAKIEARLQSIVEGSAALFFSNFWRTHDLAAQLVAAMQANIHMDETGRAVAPNLYTLQVNPGQFATLHENQALLEALTLTLHEAGAEAGFVFPSPPVIRIEMSDEIPNGEIQVNARNSQRDLPRTSSLELESLETGDSLPVNAFLIVDGTQIFPLTQVLVNIGRRADNQLVVDDPRVSRVHAQLRAVRGRYILFDLDSTGGTFINGKPIQQGTLYPGDVISLAGVPLVFGQDNSVIEETQDFNPYEADPSSDAGQSYGA